MCALSLGKKQKFCPTTKRFAVYSHHLIVNYTMRRHCENISHCDNIAHCENIAHCDIVKLFCIESPIRLDFNNATECSNYFVTCLLFVFGNRWQELLRIQEQMDKALKTINFQQQIQFCKQDLISMIIK